MKIRRLSTRTRVLRLIARGYAYKEVAKELFISIKTVETHVSRCSGSCSCRIATNSPGGLPIAAW